MIMENKSEDEAFPWAMKDFKEDSEGNLFLLLFIRG